MEFRDIARANDNAAQLTKLKQWLKDSWHANDPDCRVVFADRDNQPHMIEIPFAPVRVAVKEEIDRIEVSLRLMGVNVPD